MTTLAFTRDSTKLVVFEGDAIKIISLDRDTHVRLPVLDVIDFCVGDRSIWIAHSAPATLSRFDDNGTLIDQASLPPGSRLVAAMGAPLVAWIGPSPVLIDGTAKLVVSELADDIEFVLPIASTRQIVVSRGRLQLREQRATRWTVPLESGAAVRDGARVLDGNAIVLAITGPSGNHVMVVGLREGARLHRFVVPEGAVVRFAPTRSLAMLCVDQRRIVILDLRFGRIMVDRDVGSVFDDAAIDTLGQHVALRVAATKEVVTISVADLIAAQAAAAVPSKVADVADALVEPEPPPTEREDVELIDPFAARTASLACPALPVRIAVETASPAQIATLLGVQRGVAVALSWLAIARAWDEGRLAHPRTSELPFHSEVSGIVAGHAGLAIDEVVSAKFRLEDALEAMTDALAAIAPALAPLDVLALEHGLDPLACEIVMLVAAPNLWGDLSRLYGILCNDEGRAVIDEQLVCALLAERADASRVALALDSDGPLIRLGLIRAGQGKMRPFLALSVDDVVVRLLRGVTELPALEPLVHPIAATRTLAELHVPTSTKLEISAALAGARMPLRIAIRGRVGSGRHTLLAAISETAGRKLGIIDAAMAVRDAKSGGLLQLVLGLERAAIAGLLPCVDNLELTATDDLATRDLIKKILREYPGPLAVRASPEATLPLDPGFVAIELPALSLGERATSWQRTLAQHSLVVRDLSELADRYSVGPGVFERVVEDLARNPPEDDAGAKLEAGIRQHLANRLGSTATRVTRLPTWAQIILPIDIEDSLTELVARIKHRRTVLDTWGFSRVMTTSRGVTALFQGGPGTGKTLVAGAIANELGMDLYRVDLSRVMSKWIGETEQNLAKLFDAAEDGNAIILFDEADSLFAKRTEVKSSVDRYANLEVNYLLQRIDTFEGIAILTTNFGSSIDAAFKRRLSLRLSFPFPDEEVRERLWRAHLPPEVPIAGTLDLQELARRYQLSGGYIRNCALRAAFLAVEEHASLSMNHLERAIKAEFREIGKIAESGVLE